MVPGDIRCLNKRFLVHGVKLNKLNMDSVIKDLLVRDIRFPTSLEQAGSDAMVGIVEALSISLFFFKHN